VVIHRWDSFVSGSDYVRPPRPSDRQLSELLEIAYLSSSLQEEGRYPQFNILAVPSADSVKSRYLGDIWEFDAARLLSIEEVRRLAPVVDFKKSGMLAKWDASRWYICGLVDFGTSWSRAKVGFQYHFQSPECLFLQVDRPGRMKVYQGAYLLAALVDGKLERHNGMEINTTLSSALGGFGKVWRKIEPPEIEEPREYHNFAFTAFWNVFSALVNCISEAAHGGAVIITQRLDRIFNKQVRIKYRQNSPILRDAYISFMRARNRTIDLVIGMERGDHSLRGERALAELELIECQSKLVEAIRFVARLSACDGAIIMSDDFRLLGFGAEILSELKADIRIREAVDELRGTYKPLDVDQFGQRHRSAIKLVSQQPSCTVIVISQDGPISGVWSNEKKTVNVRKGASFVNLEMPFS